MSVERQFNVQGQMRWDVPHMRTLESSNANDFDVLAGQSLAGGQALVVRGFNLIATNAVGAPATNLQLQVDPGLVWHFNASEAGTIFRTIVGTAPEVLISTNAHVQGSFTASQLNYVGLDLLRSSDPTTSDIVQFLDANTLEEAPETVPLARTLEYSIVISTSDFASQPNILPLALVTTDANNHVVSLQDARNMAFRLGTGGTIPNASATYAWPQGRNETANADGFSGGDKAFASLRDAMQGIEGRLQELGGGPFWYSPTADRHVKLVRNLSTRFATGDNFEVDGSGHLLWQGLAFVFCNAQDLSGNAIYENTINDQTVELTGLTDIQVGECIYVDINEQPAGSLYPTPLAVQAVKAQMSAVSLPTPPYSRWVIAWRTSYGYFTRDSQFGVGTILAPASPTANGVVELNTAAATALLTTPPVVVADMTAHAGIVDAGAAVATGLTRGYSFSTAPTFGNANLSIGYGASDQNVIIGDGNSLVGNQLLQLGYGRASNVAVTRLDGNVIQIGVVQSHIPTIQVGASTSTSLTMAALTASLTTTNLLTLSTNTGNLVLSANSGNVTVDSTSGNVFFGSATGGSVNVGNSTSTNIQGSNVLVQAGTTSLNLLGATSATLNATSGPVSVGTGSGVTAINVGTTGTGATAMTLGTTTGPLATLSLLCGNGSSGGTINIGNENAPDAVVLGSTAGRTSIVLQSNNGQVTANVNGGTINIGNESASDTITLGKNSAGGILNLFGALTMGNGVYTTTTYPIALSITSQPFVICKAMTGSPSFTLPVPTAAGMVFVFINRSTPSIQINSSSGNIYTPTSSTTSYTLPGSAVAAIRLIWDGSDWNAF